MTTSTSRGTRQIPAHAAFVALVALLAVQLAGGSGSSKAGGRWHFSASERCMIEKINDFRASEGKSRLRTDKQLGFVARRHARKIANAGSIFHDNNMTKEITRWRRLGQNTGRGAQCGKVFRAFKNSPDHRENMLDSYRFLGVGTAKSDGYLYVQQVFESRKDPGNIYHKP